MKSICCENHIISTSLRWRTSVFSRQLGAPNSLSKSKTQPWKVSEWRSAFCIIWAGISLHALIVLYSLSFLYCTCFSFSSAWSHRHHLCCSNLIHRHTKDVFLCKFRAPRTYSLHVSDALEMNFPHFRFVPCVELTLQMWWWGSIYSLKLCPVRQPEKVGTFSVSNFITPENQNAQIHKR